MKDKKKRKPKYIKKQKIDPIIELEDIKPPIRYLGELANDPIEGNLGDYYYDTGLSKMKALTRSGRVTF